MIVRSLLITPLCLLISLSGYSQDTTRKKYRFDIGFESLAVQHFYNYNSKVSQPALIRDMRKTGTSLPVGFDSITDNPYMHGAMYMAIKTTTTLANKLTLKADLYGEYRGFSYGTFYKDNLVLFPVLEIAGEDTLHIGRHKLFIEGKVGQFLNERLDEGLMIYNIDLQGVQTSLRYKNEKLSFTIYGDMSNAIGLEVDDLKSISYEHYMMNDSMKLGFSYAIAAPPYVAARHFTYLNLFAGINCQHDFRAFAQVGYKPLPASTDLRPLRETTSQIAFVAGIQKEYTGRRLHLSNSTTLRYYGQTYNFYHHDVIARYRDSAHNDWEMYGNTTGAYLYPLRKFETPFSQWAVFTEYQLCNLWAVSFTGTCRYTLHDKLSIGLDYDVNAIFAKTGRKWNFINESGPSNFIYPFFKSSIQYLPLKECYLSLFLSNKTMNLDISYPTHYLMKKPFVGVEMALRM